MGYRKPRTGNTMDIQVEEIHQAVVGLLAGCGGAPTAAARGYSDAYRKQLRLWMRDIMRRKGWSAERWARQAGVAGTTITRFLNTEDPQRTPNTSTLAKLASAAGVPGMQEQQQVLIGIIRKPALLGEARLIAPQPLDIFGMPTIEHIPAPQRYADCVLVEMDNGRMAICRPAKPAGLEPGRRVLVLRNLQSTAAYWVEPPRLVPVETAGSFAGTLPLVESDPTRAQVLGIMAGEYIDYEG